MGGYALSSGETTPRPRSTPAFLTVLHHSVAILTHQTNPGELNSVFVQQGMSGAQRQDKGQRAQTEAQEAPAECEEELLPSEGD